jgi:acetolactate synthase-1/3 small subunit
VVDVTPRSFTIEVTGAPDKINAVLELLTPMGIKEIVRSGPVVIGRGSKGVTG